MSKSGRAATSSSIASMQRTMLSCAEEAGKILVKYFGKRINPREKESASSVVCDADLAAEAYYLKIISRQFPDHNLICEESGRIWKHSEYTWVIDPLDGTSNFVAGLPWFGTQIAVLHRHRPILAAMYLPLDRTFYTARAGQGAKRNGRRAKVTSETNPRNILCAFGFDPTPSPKTRRAVELLMRVAGAIRNTRTTNSLVDFCYTIDGRLGGCFNLKAKIWDIAPIDLILPEAGGIFTDIEGKPIRYDMSAAGFGQDYTLLGASRALHPKLVKIVTAR